MDIKFNVEKGTGYGYASLLRQTLISSTASVKPIAFRLSEGSMYKCGPNVIDNMQLGAKLADLTFKVSDSCSMPYTISCKVNGVLRASDLCKAYDVTVSEDEKDTVLLELIDPSKEMSITVILDSNSGFRSHSYNRKVLDYLGHDLKGYNVISARYTDVTVKQSDIEEDLDGEIVKLSISSKSSEEKKKVEEAIDKIVNTLTKIKEEL